MEEQWKAKAGPFIFLICAYSHRKYSKMYDHKEKSCVVVGPLIKSPVPFWRQKSHPRPSVDGILTLLDGILVICDDIDLFIRISMYVKNTHCIYPYLLIYSSIINFFCGGLRRRVRAEGRVGGGSGGGEGRKEKPCTNHGQKLWYLWYSVHFRWYLIVFDWHFVWFDGFGMIFGGIWLYSFLWQPKAGSWIIVIRS